MTSGCKVLETWFRRVWKEEDTSAIGEMFAGGHVEGLGAQTNMTAADFEAFRRNICVQFYEIDIIIDRCMEQGEWIAALCTFKATARASGKKIRITGQVMGRVADGKLHEGYNHWDFLGLWSQVGSLPPDSFEKGLMGEKIA